VDHPTTKKVPGAVKCSPPPLTLPEGVKILSLGIKGNYNIISEFIFLEDMKLCRYISY